MARLTSLSKMIVKVNPTHRLIYVLSPSQKPHFCHGEVASAKKTLIFQEGRKKGIDRLGKKSLPEILRIPARRLAAATVFQLP